jgi:hypothetical protein
VLVENPNSDTNFKLTSVNKLFFRKRSLSELSNPLKANLSMTERLQYSIATAVSPVLAKSLQERKKRNYDRPILFS